MEEWIQNDDGPAIIENQPDNKLTKETWFQHSKIQRDGMKAPIIYVNGVLDVHLSRQDVLQLLRSS